MRAAAEAFADKGFMHTTLSTISNNAGVSNGALHFHFENKDTLATAIENTALDTIRRITEQADLQHTSAIQRVVNATHELLTTLRNDIVVRAGYELLTTPPRRKRANDIHAEWHHWIDQTLHAAQRQGELAQDIRPAHTATTIAATTIGLHVLHTTSPTTNTHQSLDHYWQTLLPQLAPPRAN
jgi:AcrR family transcriptional regulator